MVTLDMKTSPCCPFNAWVQSWANFTWDLTWVSQVVQPWECWQTDSYTDGTTCFTSSTTDSGVKNTGNFTNCFIHCPNDWLMARNLLVQSLPLTFYIQTNNTALESFFMTLVLPSNRPDFKAIVHSSVVAGLLDANNMQKDSITMCSLPYAN